jgi:hypothetical protein
MQTKIGLIINMSSTIRHGLEVYQVTVNNVLMHEYLSRELAVTCFKRLVMKYS